MEKSGEIVKMDLAGLGMVVFRPAGNLDQYDDVKSMVVTCKKLVKYDIDNR